MREISFRGRRIGDGEWIEGDLINACTGESYIVTNYLDEFSHQALYEWTEVDPQTVGQYIGLNDKNGVGIYEGDIMHDGILQGEIEWVQEHCAFKLFTRNPSKYWDLETDGETRNSEVIGNIYENPELIHGT